MTVYGRRLRRDQTHLLPLYGLEVSPDLISTVTDAVLETVAEWQNRPLEPMYPLVLFDALGVKIRDEGLVRNKAVYVALGVTPEGDQGHPGPLDRDLGRRQVLVARHDRTEEPRRRGHSDRRRRWLKGFPEAIAAVFPPTKVQTFTGEL